MNSFARVVSRISFVVGILYLGYLAVDEWFVPSSKKAEVIKDLKLDQEDLCFALAKAAGKTLNSNKGTSISVSRFGGVQTDSLVFLAKKWTAFSAADWVAWDYVPGKGCAISYVMGKVGTPLEPEDVVIRIEGPLDTVWDEFASVSGHSALPTLANSQFMLLATGGEWTPDVFAQAARQNYTGVIEALSLVENDAIFNRRVTLYNNALQVIDEWVHAWRSYQMNHRAQQVGILLLALLVEFIWFYFRVRAYSQGIVWLVVHFFSGCEASSKNQVVKLSKKDVPAPAVQEVLPSGPKPLTLSDLLSRASSVGGEVLRGLVAASLGSSPTADSLRVANDKVSAVQGHGDLLTSARRFGEDTVAECMDYLFEGQLGSAQQLIRQKEYQRISGDLRTASFQLGVEAQVDELLYQGSIEEARKVIESARARIGFQAQIQNLRAWVKDHSRDLDPHLLIRVASFDPKAPGAHKELNRLEREVQAVKTRLGL